MGRGSGSCSCLPRLFCGRALAVVGLVSLLVVGSLGSVLGTTLSSEERLEHEFVLGRTDSDHKHVNQQELDFNHMSKRRVPNGPDPIHNRRAGNSGRPPGRA
ncbi:CLAVATA3/ESR (CLE)-related protein 25 isoform X2 [Neltuma alba]|uniref:CLAVATA3/ESR (CLE)-related protein 25 isoform X2 n=1 Tax=Neltuma alba TaxID=207710 RepID=UPI0010A4D1D6|nr:CLAVATA3/ESR (CLE)-related protein 25 isoform X2 [Prosopis alba]